MPTATMIINPTDQQAYALNPKTYSLDGTDLTARRYELEAGLQSLEVF